MRRIWVLVVAAVLAGCSGGGTAAGPSSAPVVPVTPEASATPDDYNCLTLDQLKGAFQLKLDGSSTDAVVQGSGKVGVVFAHMSGQTVCEWAPLMPGFAAKGYQGLAYTSSGGMQADVASAISELKRRGAQRVVLVGGSMGGTAVLAAAAQQQALPVQAVVSLSSPLDYAGVDAEAAVRKLTVPVLFLASEGDGEFPGDATALNKECVSPHHQLKIATGGSHSSGLLDADPTAKAAMDAFLKQYAPAS